MRLLGEPSLFFKARKCDLAIARIDAVYPGTPFLVQRPLHAGVIRQNNPIPLTGHWIVLAVHQLNGNVVRGLLLSPGLGGFFRLEWLERASLVLYLLRLRIGGGIRS